LLSEVFDKVNDLINDNLFPSHGKQESRLQTGSTAGRGLCRSPIPEKSSFERTPGCMAAGRDGGNYAVWMDQAERGTN